jgi:hypothetical protein
MKFRKKPTIVNAVQYDGNNGPDILLSFPDFSVDDLETLIHGDWVVQGPGGNIYSCGDAVFKEQYEKI